MFDIYARSFLNAARFTQFTRPQEQPTRPIKSVEGDRAEREREARATLKRFTFWV
ncbi:hypothetical protein [Roseibium sp.]|uniref:hypothetical protein n=1 Tax=Roseibium sp. TaxID=1936156 RepID=UPI003A97AAF1